MQMPTTGMTPPATCKPVINHCGIQPITASTKLCPKPVSYTHLDVYKRQDCHIHDANEFVRIDCLLQQAEIYVHALMKLLEA